MSDAEPEEREQPEESQQPDDREQPDDHEQPEEIKQPNQMVIVDESPRYAESPRLKKRKKKQIKTKLSFERNSRSVNQTPMRALKKNLKLFTGSPSRVHDHAERTYLN